MLLNACRTLAHGYFAKMQAGAMLGEDFAGVVGMLGEDFNP